MMVSKGTFCLLALFLLVKSSQQRASEDVQDLQRQSSQEENVRSGMEDERSALVDASAGASANSQVFVRPMPGPRPRPIVPPGLPRCVYDEQVIQARLLGECYVCVCVRRWNSLLEPVCGSCNQCEPPSPWVPTTHPPPHPTTPAEVPTCDPLPTNRQFQNPLDPCQICICKQLPDMFGRLSPPTIECQMNPNCIRPSTDKPVVDNTCKYYPKNVWFQNPTVPCQLCTCTDENTIFGPRTHLSCYPDPNCDIHTTVAPTTSKPTDDPLGPRPHQSCLPFTPNVPFDHPWDPCQTCVCSEFYRPGLINIDVNCYTKKECCLEYLPYPQITTSRPYIPAVIQPYGGGAGASAHSYAHADGSGSASADSNAYANSLSPYGLPGQSSAEAGAVASANNNAYIYSPIGPNGLPMIVPGQGAGANANAISSAIVNDDGSRLVFPGMRPGPLGPSGQSSASANANANANIGGGVLYPGQYPGMFGGADASASAYSNANSGGGYLNPGFIMPPGGQALSESSATVNANVNVGNNGMLMYPDQAQMWPGQGWAEADANAVANAGGGLNGYNSLAQANAQAQAEAQAQALAQAQAQAQAMAQGQAQAMAQAQAQALAQAMAAGQTHMQPNSPLYGSYHPGGYIGGAGQALANANANANALVGGYGDAAGMPGVALKSGDEDESGSS